MLDLTEVVLVEVDISRVIAASSTPTLIFGCGGHLDWNTDTLSLSRSNLLYFEFRSTELELLQRYRRDRRELLNFLLAASVIKKVIMPPGAVSYDDIDLDQISVDYILECARKSKEHLEFASFNLDR